MHARCGSLCRHCSRLLAALRWAGFAPIHVPSRDELFEIPKGTYARRMAGDKVEILPSQIRLTLGLNDVLLLRNLDEVPQVFGPTHHDAGPEFPAAVRESGRVPVRVHRARERADDRARGAVPGDAVVEDPLARA